MIRVGELERIETNKMKRTNLIEAREAKGLSQKDLASLALGKGKGGYGTCYNWERGVSTPHPKVMFRISKILGKSAEYLFPDLLEDAEFFLLTNYEEHGSLKNKIQKKESLICKKTN